MENLEFLAGAFALFWGMTFAYMFSITRRQRQLEQELRTLEHLIKNIPSEARSSEKAQKQPTDAP